MITEKRTFSPWQLRNMPASTNNFTKCQIAIIMFWLLTGILNACACTLHCGAEHKTSGKPITAETIDSSAIYRQQMATMVFYYKFAGTDGNLSNCFQPKLFHCYYPVFLFCFFLFVWGLDKINNPHKHFGQPIGYHWPVTLLLQRRYGMDDNTHDTMQRKSNIQPFISIQCL